MTIPKFTAEASLYETSGRYHMGGIAHQTDGAICPALRRDLNCVNDCLDRCVGAPFSQLCLNSCVKRCPVLVFEPLPF